MTETPLQMFIRTIEAYSASLQDVVIGLGRMQAADELRHNETSERLARIEVALGIDTEETTNG